MLKLGGGNVLSFPRFEPATFGFTGVMQNRSHYPNWEPKHCGFESVKSMGRLEFPLPHFFMTKWSPMKNNIAFIFACNYFIIKKWQEGKQKILTCPLIGTHNLWIRYATGLESDEKHFFAILFGLACYLAYSTFFIRSLWERYSGVLLFLQPRKKVSIRYKKVPLGADIKILRWVRHFNINIDFEENTFSKTLKCSAI